MVEAADSGIVQVDKYRSHLYGEAEKDTNWRHGEPPKYDLVNKLFEEGRTKEWPKGSLEEVVQNAVKTWEMELTHKTRLPDFKTINPDKFTFSVNGRKAMTGEETLAVGSYNALLQTSLPKELQYYSPESETFESSHALFKTAFPRGFAWEVLAVYSPPPVIAFKFRHWAFYEGSFQDREPTGEKVEFTGMGVINVDAELRVEELEIYYDPSELFGGLLKGAHMVEESKTDGTVGTASGGENAAAARLCPVLKGLNLA